MLNFGASKPRVGGARAPGLPPYPHLLGARLAASTNHYLTLLIKVEFTWTFMLDTKGGDHRARCVVFLGTAHTAHLDYLYAGDTT